MEAFRYHVYACNQRKPDGVPCCSANGSEAVIDLLRREIAGLNLDVQLTACQSLGLCESGPNLVVYPDGVWYTGVKASDVTEIAREHLMNGRVVERLARRDPGGIRDEIDRNKTRMLAAFALREKAGDLPDNLHAQLRAFQESRILLTAVELDVFTAVEQTSDSARIAEKISADPRATRALLDALTALDLLTKQDGTYSCGPVAKRHLCAGSPADARGAILHTAGLWERWTNLTACVRSGSPAERKEMDRRGEAWTRSFIAAMHRSASVRAPELVRTIGAEGVGRLLDLGGGSGAIAIAFAQASSTLRAVVFDLPSVTPIAQGHIDEAGLADRVAVQAGDMLADDLGADHDLVVISQICHMFGATDNGRLLRRAHSCLAPGGRVVIQDFIMEADRTAPKTGAIFAVNMLVGTQSGSTYTAEEYAAWLGEAGFSEIRHVRLPGPTSVVMGVR